MNALALAGLAKSFGATAAVSSLSLRVEPGVFLGVVGPNGAGKTTALSMAVGLLQPDAGTSHIFGYDVWSRPGGPRAKELVGVLPDGLALPGRLTGPELLSYLGLLRGLSSAVVASRIEELFSRLELAAASQVLVADYSTGMRNKLGLAVALLHNPRLLVLDEPLEAVDPVSVMTVRAILRGFVDAGGSVVMSSHVMALVQQLCDRVAVLQDGCLVAEGPVSEVRGELSLESRFSELVGAPASGGGLSWFGS